MTASRTLAVPPLPQQLWRFLYAVLWRFYKDECLVRASALAYVILLSIVPLFALMFAVLKGLGAQARLEPLLLSRLALDPETTERIIGFIDQTNVGTLGALGAAALILTVVSVLGAIEGSFNHIWRVPRGRSYWRMLTDYSSVMILTPLLLLAAVAITSSIQERDLMRLVLESAYLNNAVVQALRLLPIVINSIALGILYVIMTNRRPHLPSIALGAIVAGTLWHAVQWAYVAFQIGMARYNAIYGALSQLPVTLVWLYVSAVIVLLGAEIAAVAELGAEPATAEAAAMPAFLIGVQLLVRAADSFAESGEGVEATNVARELGVDPQAVRQVAERLAQGHLLVAVDDQPWTFVLARRPEAIPLSDVDTLTNSMVLPRGCDPRVAQLAERYQTPHGTAHLADVISGTAATKLTS